jgi:hypothetical protein
MEILAEWCEALGCRRLGTLTWCLGLVSWQCSFSWCGHSWGGFIQQINNKMFTIHYFCCTTFGYLKTEDWFEGPQIFRLWWHSATCGNHHFFRKVWWMWGLNYTRRYQIEFKKLENFKVFKVELKTFLLDLSF